MSTAADFAIPPEPFLYLSARVAELATRALAPDAASLGRSPYAFVPGAAAALDVWRDGDIERAADLLDAAYADDSGRFFAPHGELDEWLRYVTILVEDTQCGTIEPELSRVLRDGHGLRALALVTSVSPAVIHVAQLAVHPDWRRRGLASWLLTQVAAAALAVGAEQMTLLVRESNREARRLYASLGFIALGLGGHYVER